jgi:hypothetical protein
MTNKNPKISRSSSHMQPRKTAAGPLNPGDEAAPGTPGTGEDICPQCRGAGRLDGAPCPNCGGSGRIVEAIGGA